MLPGISDLLEILIAVLTITLILFLALEARAIYVRRIGRNGDKLFTALFWRSMTSLLVFVQLFTIYARQILQYPSSDLSTFLVRLQWVLILVSAMLAKVIFISAMRQR